MNDFIVWYSNDLNQDKFAKEFTLQELISQDHLDYISDSPLLKTYKVDSIHNSVGLKDVNEIHLYADCSIVHFESRSSYKQVFGELVKGFFTYDNERCAYMIIPIGTSEQTRYYLSPLIRDIRRIDTIQKNKLGLIK